MKAHTTEDSETSCVTEIEDEMRKDGGVVSAGRVEQVISWAGTFCSAGKLGSRLSSLVLF
jgi:hypothetical protein